MEAALELEKKVNKSLLDLHKVADSHGDFQVRKTPIDTSLSAATLASSPVSPIFVQCTREKIGETGDEATAIYRCQINKFRKITHEDVCLKLSEVKEFWGVFSFVILST